MNYNPTHPIAFQHPGLQSGTTGTNPLNTMANAALGADPLDQARNPVSIGFTGRPREMEAVLRLKGERIVFHHESHAFDFLLFSLNVENIAVHFTKTPLGTVVAEAQVRRSVESGSGRTRRQALDDMAWSAIRTVYGKVRAVEDEYGPAAIIEPCSLADATRLVDEYVLRRTLAHMFNAAPRLPPGVAQPLRAWIDAALRTPVRPPAAPLVGVEPNPGPLVGFLEVSTGGATVQNMAQSAPVDGYYQFQGTVRSATAPGDPAFRAQAVIVKPGAAAPTIGFIDTINPQGSQSLLRMTHPGLSTGPSFIQFTSPPFFMKKGEFISTLNIAAVASYISYQLLTIEPNPGPPSRHEIIGGGDHKMTRLLREGFQEAEDKATPALDFTDTEPVGTAAMTEIDSAQWFVNRRADYRRIRTRVKQNTAASELLFSQALFLGLEMEKEKEKGDKAEVKPEATGSAATTATPPTSAKPPGSPGANPGSGNKPHLKEKEQKDKTAAQHERREQRRKWRLDQIGNTIAGAVTVETACAAVRRMVRLRGDQQDWDRLARQILDHKLPPWVAILPLAMHRSARFGEVWREYGPYIEDTDASLEFFSFCEKLLSCLKPEASGWVEDLTVFGCVEKNPGPWNPESQEKAIQEGAKISDIEKTAPAGEVVNGRELWAETAFLQTGLNPNITDVNSLAPFSVSTVNNAGARVTRTFFPREILFVPDAVNIAGVATPRAVSSRWVVFAEVQVSGRPLLPSEASTEMVQASIKGMKNLMRNDNIVIRGWRTNDVIAIAQAKSVRGICLTQMFLKLVLQYFSQAYADQLQNVPEVGQMSNYRNTNTTDPTSALTIDANVSDAAAGVGESLGGATAVFPFNRGAGQLVFITGLDTAPPGQTVYCCPPGFINMFTNGAVNSSVGIAAFVMALAAYPGFLMHCRRSVLDNGANPVNIRAVPNSASVYVPGDTSLYIMLPRSGPVPTPTNQVSSNAAALLQPTTGSTPTTVFPVANTPLEVSFPGTVIVHNLAEYLYSWATDINRSVIRKVFAAFYALGDFDDDLWAAWELACACMVRYPEMVQTNPDMTPVPWARGAAAPTATEIRHTLFTGFHTQQVATPLTTAPKPPAEAFVSGLDPLAWNKVATGTAFKDTEEYVVKQLPYWLSDSIPLALAMVQTRLYAAAAQACALTHRVPESTLTQQVFSNAQFMTFRDVAEEFVCPGDGTNLSIRLPSGAALMEKALTLIHGNRVAREPSGLNVFNRWTVPKEVFGNVIDSATGAARQGYSWGVLPDIWFNLIVRKGFWACMTPISPYMPEGSRPVRENHRNIKPAFTAAKWGPLARVSEKYTYLDQGDLLELTDEEIWNQRLMYLDTVLGCDTENIQEVVFTDRLPAGTLPGDRQRTVVEFGLTPSHAICSLKIPFYDNVAGVPLIPTTVAAAANAIISGINPPNVLALITMHVSGASSYIGPKRESYMMRILKGLKGGPASSAETKQGSSATDSIITTSGKS